MSATKTNLKNGDKVFQITGWARLAGSPTGRVEFTASEERATLAHNEGAKVLRGTLASERKGSNSAKVRSLIGAQPWTPEDAGEDATIEDLIERDGE